MLRRLLIRLSQLLAALVALNILIVALLRWVPPPFTALMIERKIESWQSGTTLDLQRTWQPWEQLPDSLKVAVIAGEDQKFPEHHGFDWTAIRSALEHNSAGGHLRGGSTLSQQVAKNLFLWSARSWVRKGIEAWFTLLIETLWTKQRILEIYLNSVEWDDGVFGAEAAARHHFRTTASALTPYQASLLAAILPNPRAWSPVHPSAHVARKAAWIRRQVTQLGGARYLEQLKDPDA